MIDWMHAHPWMTFAVLLLLVCSVNIKLVWPIGLSENRDDHEPDETNDAVMTPDEARGHMLTSRQRAARAVAANIDCFIEHGDPDTVICIPFDSRQKDAKQIIERLLEYKSAGWIVNFSPGGVSIALPKVVS